MARTDPQNYNAKDYINARRGKPGIPAPVANAEGGQELKL
jgi:hypothetical protein